MTAEQWKKKIKKDCKAVNTYRPQFDSVIDTLAGILEKRDNAEELFIKTGSNILVKHTNKAGAVNIEQNPTIRLINDLNRDAMQYWKELGLTASALKRINENAIKTPERKSALAEALSKFG